MKKVLCFFICLILITSMFFGCVPASSIYNKYRCDFFDTFDTIVTCIAYTKSEEEFNELAQTLHTSLLYYHRLFNIYHNYEGLNNIKTINDNAGKKPVKVDEALIDLLVKAKSWYTKTNGTVNVALGSVLSIWHDYREAGLYDLLSAELPPIDVLQQAAQYTDIEKIIIDEQASTVFLADKNMRLDVGAIAKGYAVEAAAALLLEKGYDSVLISAGGNVRAIGAPKDGIRKKWGIGIKDPDSPFLGSTDEENLLDVSFVSDTSVVSSGGYERYYTVNGKDYHHLIDPDTLMPANYYKAVTVITKDSVQADILSTALFIMPPKQSLAFAESLKNVEALWIMPDNELVFTSGMKQLLRDLGGASYD